MMPAFLCPSAHLQFSSDNPEPLFENAHYVGARFAVSSILLEVAATSMREKIRILSTFKADDFKRTAALANSIGEKAKKSGLQFVYHNHNWEFQQLGEGATGYDLLMSETDPSLVKHEMDCGWVVTGGQNPIDLLKRYRDRYRLLHIKDFTRKSPTTTVPGASGETNGTELGRGRIDYKPIFSAARAPALHITFQNRSRPAQA